jgi:hypothetical protein
MASVAYKTHPKILVSTNKRSIYPTLVDLLDKLTSVPMGRDMLTEIDATSHSVELRGITDQSGSSCTPLEEERGLVLLATALKQRNAIGIKNELTAALGRARMAGVPTKFLITQIAQGLPPATYIASVNVAPPKGPLPPIAELDRNAAQRLAQLNKLLNGDLTNRDVGFELALRRTLRPWLQAGRGCSCVVEIDLYRATQTRSDGSAHTRDIVVSLGHELVHAWHFTRGKVLTWYGEAPPDLEELMTVGLPPYNFEKFSENMLRGQSVNLDMRLAY